MKAIRVLPGKPPEVFDLPKGYKNLQKEVGGLFALVSLEDNVDAFANDEGIILGMPFNIVLPAYEQEVPICGPVVVVASDEEGESVGLSDEQTDKWLKVLAGSPRSWPPNPFAPAVRH